MRTATADDYHRRLRQSLDFIVQHLGEPCGVEDIAAVSAFSRFHCQRMFRAMTGESITELIRRLRLENAGYRLRQERTSILEIALDAGYGSEESFSRAFRRGCGVSPGKYRKTWPPPTFSSPRTRVRYDPIQRSVEFDPPGGTSNLRVQIKNLPEIRAARIRHVGPYNEVAPHFERLLEWAATISSPAGMIFSMSYDDPSEMDAKQLRSDACIQIQDEVPAPCDIAIDTLLGGRYAIHRVQGPYDRLPQAYQRLYALWLPRSGEELDDRPCVEIYQNTPRESRPADLLTDLCLPLRRTDHHP